MLYTANRYWAIHPLNQIIKILNSDILVRKLFKVSFSCGFMVKLEKFFDDQTMSVHLRENSIAKAKRGQPGAWSFDAVSKGKLLRADLQAISDEIIEECEQRDDGFVELDRAGSTIVQLGAFRIVIVKPPFGDGWEITAVRPVKKLELADYKMSDALRQRITQQAEGILIAGRPGEGKSTFARALAEEYAAHDKVVKSVESPRDMLLSDSITQYSISHGSSEEIHDVLLLSRPDNTIFDEMRNINDFALFTDLRLAGIGMAGVVHATAPIDAVQRFLGKIELGVIPHVVDTVVFIKHGVIGSVLKLSLCVKVPAGMVEADLARPVVEVHDFDNGKLVYEIYTYGEQTVVIPVTAGGDKKPVHRLAEYALKEKMSRYVDDVEVEIKNDSKAVVYVPASVIPRIIGREGKTIEKIEREVGIGIDVQELKSGGHARKVDVDYDVEVKKNITFYLDAQMVGHDVEIFDGDESLALVKVGKKALIRFRSGSPVGKKIVRAMGMDRLKVVGLG
jgi:ATPase